MKKFVNIGTVKQAKDGIILLEGLSDAQMLEKIVCKDKSIDAVVINLEEDHVGAIIFEDITAISEGDVFETTGEVISIPASYQMVGRVIDALGRPLDGEEIKAKQPKLMPIEKIAPSVMERQPVDTPLATGILVADSMIPIGRGQRELIIGDRGIGKTAFAIDTIINQKDADPKVICIYVAIGQKRSQIAQLIDKLDKYGALSYTIVVSASASDSVAMQYIAPYSATAIAEYYLEKGDDVLIVYDDLTKHSWAYRQISLTLGRPPGREAYPGDIFYLHSRLLERSCRMSDSLSGGSITSLPIVETQLGDLSAYIPTNIISITDGQIYFETDLFNSGVRPAIDPSSSVSRVGSAAQTKEMKKIAGKLRLEIAQFKELEAFAQFGSADLDEETKQKIKRGNVISELLKQRQYSPLTVYEQVALLFSVNEGYFDTVEKENIEDTKLSFLDEFQKFKDKNDYQKFTKKFFAELN